MKAGYMLADAVFFNLTWSYALADRRCTSGPVDIGDITINPMNQYQLFQADLNFKF